MMYPEFWMNLIFLYGPIALLVFFVFLIEPRIRKAMVEVIANKRVALALYVGHWVFVAALAIFICVWWAITNNPKSEHIIKGKIEGLLDGERIFTHSENLYLRRIIIRETNVDYEWRVITNNPIQDGTKIDFILDKSTKESEDVKTYEIVCNSNFYTDLVKIVYRRNKDRFVLVHKNKEEELQPIEQASQMTEPSFAKNPFKFVSYAQSTQPSPFSPDDLKRRLESDDPTIRYKARSDLAKIAKQEPSVVIWIQQILVNQNSSYRLQLGSVIALNIMKDFDTANKLDTSATSAIHKLCDISDITLKTQANLFFQNYPALTRKVNPQGTIVQQEHMSIINQSDFHGNVAVYVGDIKKDKPFQILVFEITPNDPKWQNSPRLTSKYILSNARRILANKNVRSPNPTFIFRYGERSYSLKGDVKAGGGEDYIDIVVQ